MGSKPVAMPFFEVGDDPGSSFPELLRRVGFSPAPDVTGADLGSPTYIAGPPRLYGADFIWYF